ncbi:MAG: sulfotransferase [Anaerolineae bacterium]
MQNPLFLLGSHKSGTSLLRSLLDGTPELFVIPVEAHFFQYGGYWVDYALRPARPADPSFDQLVDGYVSHLRQSNRSAPGTSDSALAGQWNLDAFETTLRDRGRAFFAAGNFKQFLDCYVAAMHVGLYGAPPATGRFVEKSVENAEYVLLLQRMYPGARFIHLVRNPYATLTSIRRHMRRGHFPFLGRALSALYNSYYYLYKNPRLIPDYLVIRYEDLVTWPGDVMRIVADFAGLEFAEHLLAPTVMGRPWGGNSTSGQQFTAVSARPLTGWQGAIHPLEVNFVNALFGHVLRDYGYERVEPAGSVYRPDRPEKPATYLANRWLWRVVKQMGALPVMR